MPVQWTTTQFGAVRIRWSPWPLVALLIVFSTLFALGVWQLQRAEEKQQQQVDNQQLNQRVAVPITDIALPIDTNFPIKASLTGRYLNEHTFFIANQVFQKKYVGYEVITPMDLGPTQPWVLVSRGWISPQIYEQRQSLKLDGQQSVEGVLHLPPLGARFSRYEAGVGESLRVRQLNLDSAQQWLQHPIYPAVVRLDEEQAGVMQRHWPAVYIAESPHLSYAIQWFAMAFAIIALAFFRSSNALQLLNQKPK